MDAIDVGKLRAPFPPDAVHWRVGSTNKEKTKGLALAYIDARDVLDRLDDVCGPTGWQNKYRDVGGGKLACEILIKIGDEWIGKSDGAGATDVEGDKGSFSDALKRAAVAWGIGRYLYRLESPWVSIVQKGRSYVIAPQEMKKLQGLLPNSDLTGGQHAPTAKWTKTELTKAFRELTSDVQRCSDEMELDALLESHKELIETVKTRAPSWWNGKPDSDFLGLSADIANKRASFVALVP